MSNDIQVLMKCKDHRIWVQIVLTHQNQVW